MKKKLLATVLAACMVLTMVPSVLAANSVFTDVNADDWFAEEVAYVYDEGLMIGVGNNEFDPDGYVTRAMMWSTLARLAGAETYGGYPWYSRAQLWAVDNGVSDGTMATENITREQLVTMLWRYAAFAGVDVSAGENSSLASYTDAHAVSEWAEDAMKWACAAGVINGIEGALMPQGYASRAQLAAILYRFVELALQETYTVTFMWNWGNNGVFDTVKVIKGQSINILPKPSRSGYVFNGWYTEDGVFFAHNTKVTSDTVVYANWSEYVYIAPHEHEYGEWEPNGDCSHSQKCSCDEAITEDCDPYELCSVCGFDRLAYVLEHGGEVTLSKDSASEEYAATSGNEAVINLNGNKLDGPIVNEGVLTINGDGSTESAIAGLVDRGTATLRDLNMKAGSPSDYAIISRGGATTLENVNIDSLGGGVGAASGAKLVFDGGSVAVNTTSTSGRYVFYTEGEGSEITIKSGEFSFSKTLNQKRAYIYAGTGTTIYVEGGNFGPASARKGYTAGILGSGTVVITGGTFGFDPTNWVAEGYKAVKSGKTWAVMPVDASDDPLVPLPEGAAGNQTSTVIENDPEIPDVAQIGIIGYDTLQNALDAADDGDTVTLLADLELTKNDTVKTSGNHTVMFAVENKDITLDMNGKTIKVNYDNNSLLYAVVYVGENADVTITGNGKIDLTIGDTRAGKYECAAYMFWKHGSKGSLIIKDGYYRANSLEDSMIYTNGDKIVEVNGGTFILEEAGERTNGCPWMFNGYSQNANKVLVNGGSYSVDITDTRYQYYQDEMVIAEGMIVQLMDDGLWHVIYPNASITRGDEKIYFENMADAIAAAMDNETIVFERDIYALENDAYDLGVAKLNSDRPKDQHVTYYSVTGKSITIDLNGRFISADVSNLPEGWGLAGIFSTKDGGHLTIKDSVGTGKVEVDAVDDHNPDDYANVFAMIINLDDTSSITIESGTFVLDRAVSAMIDTRSNEGVIVNGGTFDLGNVLDPGLKNGQAWTFNAKGQNTRHVIVTGGTFPADIQHQYYPFEVSIAKELALQFDPDTKMYTVVPAVAYVNEQEFSGRWYTNEIGYATLEEAYAAVEPPKTSRDGQVSAQEYVTPLIPYDGIEFNEDGTITITKDDTVFDLGGETLTITANNAITVQANNVVINGTGGGITVNALEGEKATIINVAEGGSCTVNGGTYTANTSGAGTSGTSQSKAFYAGKNATLNVNDATIIATDDNNGCVVGVNGGYSSTVLNLTNCDITVTSGDSLDNIGVQTWGKAVLKNCSIIAQANYTGANGEYTANSRGIYAQSSNATLELYDCYVWGAHSGVTSKSSVYVDGGTYEGFGHGGFYLAGGSKTSYFYNATINWAPMRDGYEYDNVAGTNAAGMYISQASNIKAYFDNCSFNMNAANGETWDKKVCPYYAVVINNGNNEVYVSNSHIGYADNAAFRLKDSYNGRYVYYGVGNTYDETNVNLLITNGKESQLIETNESYAK